MDLYKSTNTYTIESFGSREEWLTGRMGGIGGSSASACLNLNPYMSAAQLYRIKKGIEQADDISQKPYVIYGNQAEEPLRRLYELNHQQYDVQYRDNTLLRSIEKPFMYYSPDGLLLEKETNRPGILEIKTTNIMSSRMKETWDDGIPQNYYIQVLHGINVTGFEFVELWAQLKWEFPNGEILLKIKKYHIERSEVLEDLEFVKSGVSDWWHNNFLANKEPHAVLPDF